MIEFKRNPETGVVEAWKDGKKVGEILTMGNLLEERSEEKEEKE